MSIEDNERADRDDRTIFVSGITEKVTEPLLTELFLTAGPIERVCIPKEKDGGRNRTYGFVTYTHESSVPYALNIFSGTKLYGRELVMKYRNANKNQESPSSTSSSMNALMPNLMNYAMMPPQQQQQQLQPPLITQEMVQQRLLQLATLPDFGLQSFNSFPTSISFNSDDLFPSTRNDNYGSTHQTAGSHSHRDRSHRNDDRNEFVERSRNHRDDNRNRTRPYRRSRSRSPLHSRDRNRDKSPRGRDRRRDNRGSGNGNYSRWNY